MRPRPNLRDIEKSSKDYERMLSRYEASRSTSQITSLSGQWKRSPSNGLLSGVKGNNSLFHVMSQRAAFQLERENIYINILHHSTSSICKSDWMRSFRGDKNTFLRVRFCVESNVGSTNSPGKNNLNALVKYSLAHKEIVLCTSEYEITVSCFNKHYKNIAFNRSRLCWIVIMYSYNLIIFEQSAHTKVIHDYIKGQAIVLILLKHIFS